MPRSIGLILICIFISGCNKPKTTGFNYSDQSYLFVKSLINSSTGIVSSTENDTYTTVYKCALASICFIFKDDFKDAEKIFDFFNSKYDVANFQGFTQYWNAKTGEALTPVNYWEGDCSFLLIALNYYKLKKGSLGNYQNMTEGLVKWLAERGDHHNYEIIAEGLIDMYAALKPFDYLFDESNPDLLLKLHTGFLKKAAYSQVGDHIERSALVFGILDGFRYIPNFEKTDTWKCDNKTTVKALSAFSWENFINTEISAQNLLVWKIWKDSLQIDLSYIEPQMDSIRIPGYINTSSSGLPYLTQHPTDYNMYCKPIIDPTCYMFFYYNLLNPMNPGHKCFDLNYDIVECESFLSQTGDGNKEFHQDAMGDTTFQITSTNSNQINEIQYSISLHKNYSNAVISIRYSDDVPGNNIKIFVDENYKGEFSTTYSGGWDQFIWNNSSTLGNLFAGKHNIRLVCSGGSYGVNLDIIKIAEN